jgi:hypothetical protein
VQFLGGQPGATDEGSTEFGRRPDVLAAMDDEDIRFVVLWDMKEDRRFRV